MAKRSVGAYSNIEEVMDQVKSLEQSGFSRYDITVISSNKNQENLQRLDDVEIVSLEDNEPISEELTFGLGEETIRTYNSAVQEGGYVVLVDGDSEPGEAGAADVEGDSASGGMDVTPPGFGIDPRVPPVTHSDLHGDPMNTRGDVPVDTGRNPHVDSESLSQTDANDRERTRDEEEPLPKFTNESEPGTDESTINVRPIKNKNTPHSQRSEEQTDIPNESLDEDRGTYR
ncbi:general stress protein [Atopococcus tabaci]|uniref:general stress protein n=1 Tax=Atopococcus tabaci TaxID=269774 RepID=UPI0004235BE0|nr:general stress protein [Atopococcus tabaci]